MNRLLKVLYLLCVIQVATACCGKHVKFGDIIDEATQQLDELKEIVKGDILVAHDELDTFKVDFFSTGNTIVGDGTVALQQEHESIIAQITSLKELALQANKNIQVCTDDPEEVLNKLPGRFGREMLHCVGDIDREVERILNSSRYIVDVSVNTVHHLELQLRECEENILCIEPIITEIQLNMIRLPQNIKTEVTAAANLVIKMKPSLQECADVKVGEYASDANSILDDVVTCVDRILN